MSDIAIKVSVSLITYQQEHFISKAIESVLSQKTNFRFELVISDDASTDNTAKIVQEYADKYPDIIRFENRKINLGLVQNALQTISNCRGEYIALLEGDDYWVDDFKLQKQSDFLDSNQDCSFCFTNSIKFWEGSDKVDLSISTEMPEKFDLNYFLTKNVNISNNTKMFRSSVHPKHFGEWFCETVQWDWSLHVIHSKNGMIGYLDMVTLMYRRHEKAFILSYNQVLLYESGLRTLRELNKELDGKYEHYFSQTSWHHEQLAIVYLAQRKMRLFTSNLLNSLFNRPLRGFQEYRDLAWKIKHALKYPTR